jgi:kynurenine formamidase
MQQGVFIEWNGKRPDVTGGIDLSIPVAAHNGPLAWYLNPPLVTPVQADGFIGSVEQGGAVNFNNILFNPHGHGTHTETLGHVLPEIYSVHHIQIPLLIPALLISVTPVKQGSDEVLLPADFIGIPMGVYKALIVRTLVNSEEKKSRKWSGTNPPYFTGEAMQRIVDAGIEHLLTDLPSVDKEEDGGKLLAHKTFWQIPHAPAKGNTITELIFVPDSLPDGEYLLNLQIAAFVNDAAPSRPVLYPVH